MKKPYRIWNTKVDEFETLEEALKEANKRAKRNKHGCDIFIYNPSTKGWVRFITKKF